MAQQVITRVVEALSGQERTCECQDALGAALITQRDLIPPELIQRLGPIVSKYLK
jgi:hypothetical protein